MYVYLVVYFIENLFAVQNKLNCVIMNFPKKSVYIFVICINRPLNFPIFILKRKIEFILLLPLVTVGSKGVFLTGWSARPGIVWHSGFV